MSLSNKALYGEVATDPVLVNWILDLIPSEKYKDPSLRWLDPASGNGVFMQVLYERLFRSLKDAITDPLERKQHICRKMLYMVEINPEYIPGLQDLFPGGNIICEDFLTYSRPDYFDIIIGNPPFNSHGFKKVPTNNKQNKKEDGKTIWPHFIKHAFTLLRERGFLSMITPSIWMKPDKAGINTLLTNYSLKQIRCFTNTQTNRLFHGDAQTPTCFFIVQKTLHCPIISLYENNLGRYIPYLYIPKDPIPVFGASVFTKLQLYVLKVGAPIFYKTGMPSKYSIISSSQSTETSYPNIRTCRLKKNKPQLVYEYSNEPLAFYGQPKLILAHKMYGFPYYDEKGIYGISRRDNYIMVGQTPQNFNKWKDFLSSKFALYLFEGTRYRMKYLEKYVFQLIPDITKLTDFPSVITDETIADYFQLTEIERKAIEQLHTKTYLSISVD